MLSSSVVAFGFSYFRIPGKGSLWDTAGHADDTAAGHHDTAVRSLQQTGLGRHVLPLIVPTFFGGAFSIFLLKQFFDTVRGVFRRGEARQRQRVEDLPEGLSSTVKPALATSALFIFIWTWTDFLNPLIYRTTIECTPSRSVSSNCRHRVRRPGRNSWGFRTDDPSIIVLFFLAQKTSFKEYRLEVSNHRAP